MAWSLLTSHFWIISDHLEPWPSIWCQVLPHTGKPYKMELSRAKQVLGTSGKGLLVARNIPSFGTEEIKKIDLLLQHKIILQ